MRIKIALFLVLLAIISCQEDPTQPKKVMTKLVDFELHSNYFDQRGDVWFVATDESGNILAQKQMTGEGQFSLSAEMLADEKFDLLIMNVLKSSVTYDIVVYKNLTPGREWTLGIPFPSIEERGTYNVTWNGTPLDNKGYPVHIMGLNGSNVVGGFTYSCSGDDCQMQYFTAPSDRATTLYSFVPGDAAPKYFETDAHTVSGSYTYEFEENFKLYDNVFTIEGSEGSQFNNSYVNGIDGDDVIGQSFYFNSLMTPVSVMQLGYNNGYDKYEGLVVYRKAPLTYTWSVVKTSLVAADFQFPEIPFTISDESFANFNVDVQWDKNLEYYRASWEKLWTDDGTQKKVRIYLYNDEVDNENALPTFPTEMTTAYPDLLEQIIGDATEAVLYFNDDERTYDQALDKFFSPEAFEDRSTYQIARKLN